MLCVKLCQKANYFSFCQNGVAIICCAKDNNSCLVSIIIIPEAQLTKHGTNKAGVMGSVSKELINLKKKKKKL